MTIPPDNPDRNLPRGRCNASLTGEVGPTLGMPGTATHAAVEEPPDDEIAEPVLEDNADGELAEPTALTSTGLSCVDQGTRSCLGASCETHAGEPPAAPNGVGGAGRVAHSHHVCSRTSCALSGAGGIAPLCPKSLPPGDASHILRAGRVKPRQPSPFLPTCCHGSFASDCIERFPSEPRSRSGLQSPCKLTFFRERWKSI